MKIRMNLELLSNLSDIMIVTNNSRNICVLKTHKDNRNTCLKSFQDNLTCTNEQRYKWHIRAFLYDVAQIDRLLVKKFNLLGKKVKNFNSDIYKIFPRILSRNTGRQDVQMIRKITRGLFSNQSVPMLLPYLVLTTLLSTYLT